MTFSEVRPLSPEKSITNASNNSIAETTATDLTKPGLVIDPSVEYQVGTQIYFGNDLYEVCQTNVNAENQIALVLIEEVFDQPIAEENSQQLIAASNQSQNDHMKQWRQGSFDSALGSSVESSIGSSIGSSTQDYQKDLFEENVYMTRSVNDHEHVYIEPPVDESVRPGKRPKIADDEVFT